MLLWDLPEDGNWNLFGRNKKEEPSSELLALTQLFTVPYSFNHRDEAAMATPDFPALELIPDHLLKFRFNPAYFSLLYMKPCALLQGNALRLLFFFIDKAFKGLETERNKRWFTIIKSDPLNEHKRMGE